MHQQILVSVIIPVYNAQKYLSQCLDSVLSQSLRAIEVICVDDGSSDDSMSILEQYRNSDERLRILQQKNSFAGAARNNGLRSAAGEFVAFLDADDYYMDPDVLKDMLEQVRTYDLDMVKTGFDCFDSESGRIFTTAYSCNSCIPHRMQRQILRFSEYPQQLLQVADVPWNALYRKSFLEKNQITFNSLRCVNDHSFFIHCLVKAQRIMVIPRRTVRYRIEQSGSLVGGKANHYDCHLESYRLVRELTRELSPKLRQLVLQKEIYALLDWYTRLKDKAADTQKIESELKSFLQQYQEDDAGLQFLQNFRYADLYSRKRYDRPGSGRQPGTLKRLWQSWRIYGCRHVWLVLLDKLH